MMENAALWGAAILVACYLPLYFNGAPQTGRKCNPSFGSHWIWSFVWRKIIGLPLAESRFRKEDFPDASARFIFGSHPHGVMSLHHIGAMMCPAVCEKGKAFSDLSPIESRRDLAAAILFRIPILREMVRLAGCNPERPGCNQVYPCCNPVCPGAARGRGRRRPSGGGEDAQGGLLRGRACRRRAGAAARSAGGGAPLRHALAR